MSPSKVEEHSMDTWGTDSGLIFYKETHPTTAQTELSHDRRRTIKGLLQKFTCARPKYSPAVKPVQMSDVS